MNRGNVSFQEPLEKCLAISVPLCLIHESFFHGSVLKALYEISISPASRSASPLTCSCCITVDIRWRRVIRRTWLQSDGRIRVQVACNPLYRLRDTPRLLIKRRGTLPPSPCRSLRIQLRARAVRRCRHLTRHLM